MLVGFELCGSQTCFTIYIFIVIKTEQLPGPASSVVERSLRNISTSGDRGSNLAEGFVCSDAFLRETQFMFGGISNIVRDNQSRNLSERSCCDIFTERKRRSSNKLAQWRHRCHDIICILLLYYTQKLFSCKKLLPWKKICSWLSR